MASQHDNDRRNDQRGNREHNVREILRLLLEYDKLGWVVLPHHPMVLDAQT